MNQTLKADAGKPRVSLVPTQIIWDIAAVREYGVSKYGSAESWREVEPQRYRDAMLRHTLAYWADPESVDPESGLLHRCHIECNLAFLAELERDEALHTPPEGDQLDAERTLEYWYRNLPRDANRP